MKSGSAKAEAIINKVDLGVWKLVIMVVSQEELLP
jgi:hypothetical protein